MNRIIEVLEEENIKQVWLSKNLDKMCNMLNANVYYKEQPCMEVLVEIARILDVDIKDLMASNKINL